MSNIHKPKHKVYTAEFKREAVNLLETSGKSGAVLAEELGISDGSLYTWRKQLAAQGEEAFPGKGFKSYESAERFCRAYDEQRNWFRYREFRNDSVPLVRQRTLLRTRFAYLQNLFKAA